MANVGLTLRERMPIVMVGYLLGMLSWVQKPEEQDQEQDEEDHETEPLGAEPGLARSSSTSTP